MQSISNNCSITVQKDGETNSQWRFLYTEQIVFVFLIRFSADATVKQEEEEEEKEEDRKRERRRRRRKTTS